MTVLTRSLIVTAIHVSIVGSLGAKLLVDRSNYPRAWVRTAPFDPNLPIRGRYVRLRLEARIEPGAELGFTTPAKPDQAGPRPNPLRRIALSSRDGLLFARPSTENNDPFGNRSVRGDDVFAVVNEPVAYFIPEHVPDPSIRPSGEELWVEVTIPPHGPPRPIRLAVKAGGLLTPLDLD